MSATVTSAEPVTPVAPPYTPPAPAPAVSPAGTPARPWLAGLAVFAVVFAVSIIVQKPHPLGVFTDDAMYAILAKSLVEGHGYRLLHLPGAPAGTHFPPVYPALLALLWKLVPGFPENVAVFKAANALLNGVAALLAFRFARDTLGVRRGVAAFTAVVAGVGLPSLLLAGMALSEPLFLVLLLAALPLAERVRRAPTDRGALLLGAAAGVLVLTRSIGITFVAGAIGALLLSRRWRAAALTGVAALAFMLPWQLWVASHDGEIPEPLRGKYGSYAGWLSQGVERHGPEFVVQTVARNAPQSMVVLGEPLRVPRLPGLPVMPWTHWVGIVVAGLLGALGIVALATRAPGAALMLVLYLGMVAVWPFDPTRFLWGIWSLFAVTLAAGAEWGMARARPLRLATMALAGAGAIGATAYAGFGLRHDWSSGLPQRRALGGLPIVFWVQEHTRPTDVVTSEEEAMVWLYTSRQAVPNTRFTPDEYVYQPTPADRRAALDGIIRRYDPDWIIASMETVRQAALERAGPAGDLRLTDSLPGGSYIFARTRSRTR